MFLEQNVIFIGLIKLKKDVDRRKFEIADKVLVLVGRLQKKDAPGKFYESAT